METILAFLKANPKITALLVGALVDFIRGALPNNWLGCKDPGIILSFMKLLAETGQKKLEKDKGIIVGNRGSARITLLLLCGVFFLSSFFFLTGCGVVAVKPIDSVCDAIPAGSYSVICQISEKLDTKPEVIAGMLKIANVSALAADLYRARQADAFIDDLWGYLEIAQQKGATYAMAYGAMQKKIRSLPPEVQASFVALDDVTKLEVGSLGDLELSEYDYWLLFSHLADQKAIVAPFLL